MFTASPFSPYYPYTNNIDLRFFLIELIQVRELIQVFEFIGVESHQLETVKIFGEGKVIQCFLKKFDQFFVLRLVKQTLENDPHILPADL
jgi:hypothetical protein